MNRDSKTRFVAVAFAGSALAALLILTVLATRRSALANMAREKTGTPVDVWESEGGAPQPEREAPAHAPRSSSPAEAGT